METCSNKLEPSCFEESLNTSKLFGSGVPVKRGAPLSSVTGIIIGLEARSEGRNLDKYHVDSGPVPGHCRQYVHEMALYVHLKKAGTGQI